MSIQPTRSQPRVPILGRIAWRAIFGVFAACWVGFAAPTAVEAQGGLCARVTIEIEQRAVLTRRAFEAALTIFNDTTDPLGEILVEINIEDSAGNPANHLFGISDPDLSGALSGVDGTGTLPGMSGPDSVSGTAKWTILATDEAAPTAAIETYTVSGVVRHTQGGTLVTVPLFPVDIEVAPNPMLFLKYFLQSPVYSDNPFTYDIVEPAEPFSLGLLVQNAGFGLAENFRITSAEPQITENENGLLISFQIIAAQVGLAPTFPCLTVNLGDIAPGGFQVARWLLTSSLQGRFISYEASFEHVTGFGNADLSLIEAIDIFELNHMFTMDAAGDDALPDFLVNNPPEAEAGDDIPDEVHTSDGDVFAINVIPTANVSAPSGPVTDMDTTVSLSITVDDLGTSPNGWSYVNFPDPSNGEYILSGVLRTFAGPSGPERRIIDTGGPGDIVKAWATHRWLPFDDVPQFQDHRVHIVDRFAATGTYLYDLTFSPATTENFELRVSDQTNRTNSAALDAAVVGGPIFVFIEPLQPTTAISRVRFFLDDAAQAGDPFSSDSFPPFDFVGGTGTVAVEFDTTTLTKGQHTITAVLDLALGAQRTVEATFTVADGLIFSPSNIVLSLEAGDTAAPTVSLDSTQASVATFTITEAIPWLTIPAGDETGDTPATVTLNVDTTGLAPGSYNGVLTATAAGLAPRTVSIDLIVNELVGPPPTPDLVFGSSTIALSTTEGGTTSGTVLLDTSSADVAAFTVVDDAPWLTVTPGTGSTPASLALTVDATGLTAGSYTAVIDATAPGFDPANTLVTLNVQPVATPELLFSRAALDLNLQPGELGEDTFTVTTSDASPTTFTLSTTASWIVVDLNSQSAPTSVDVDIVTTSLPSGSHYAQIIPNAPGYITNPIGVSVTIPCNPISGLVCSSNTMTSVVSLSWSNGQANYLGGIEVLRGGSVIAVLPGNATAYNDFVASGNYDYTIRALCSESLESALSCNVNHTACNAIGGLAASYNYGSGQASLTWANGQVYTSIRVFRDGSEVAQLSGIATSFSEPLASGVYSYEVRGDCGGVTTTSDFADLEVCSPLTNFLCTGVPASGEVVLDWSLGESYQDITVLRDEVVLATLAGDATQYVDSAVPDGDHLYRVVANCLAGSATSVECSIDFIRCFPIINLNCVGDGLTEQIFLTWENGEDPYPGGIEIYRDGALAQTLDGAATSFTETAPFGTYDYEIVGHCSGGLTAIAQCTVELALRPCLPITNLVCVGSPGIASLSWDNGEDYTQGIEIVRDGAVVALLAGTATTFAESLMPGDYDYLVRGVCDEASVEAACTVTVLPIPFIRGDSNASGSVDVADGVYIVNYLFTSGDDPPCFSSADSNDSGGVDIADAIYVVNFLFLPDQPDIPPPYPDCGPDPTVDALGCAAYLACP